MTEKQNYKSSEDEIDLRQLFNAIGSFFSKIWKSIIYAIVNFRRTTIRNKYLIITLTALFGVFGVINNNYSDLIYNSSLILSSDYFNGRIIDNSIEKLNLLCAEEDRLGLSKELGLSQDEASSIVGFTAIPFVSEDDRVEIELLKPKLEAMNLKEDEFNKIMSRIDIENKNAYQITVNVTSGEVLDGLESSLVNYFKNNNYIKNRIISRENYLKERLTELEKENLKMDSLKSAMIKIYESIAKKNPQGSDNLYIGDQNSSDPVAIFKEGLIINKEMLEVKQELELKKDFEVIDGLTVYSKPVSAGYIKSFINGFLIGLAFAYLIIMLLSINRYLTKVESEMAV